MDTAWFAIDNDGNVALFGTGESGCVPNDAYIEDSYALEEELRKLPATGFKFDLEGMRATQWADHVELDYIQDGMELYVFLSDLVPVGDLLSRLSAQEIEATTCKCVRITITDRAAFAELHARSACMGCYREYRDEADIASHGIYRYEHTCENWIAGPYARAAVPRQPLTVDKIPKSIRDSAIAFNGRFAETAKLQPAEHWECQSWEAGWLSSDGKTARPFPDQETEWENYAADRENDEGGVKWLDEPLDDLPPAKKRWWK